ncbi:MAG TPA: polysaccharide biosynthesis/export family protein [Gemmatimonadaceae bacterium]|nr:polysaccharide biosynthesis/export family protein [Gemmatimonadaceae bacterium]
MHFGIPDATLAAGRRALLAAALFGTPFVTAGAQDSARVDASDPDSLRRTVGALRPGDAVKVLVYRNPELSADYVIDARGWLQIPGAGRIRAAGQEPADIEARLRALLLERGFSAPEVAIQPLIRVSVLGSVARPGLVAVEPGANVLQVLTLAGGPTDQADLRRTRVIRGGVVVPVDLESGLRGSGAGRITLFSNDVVVVPKRTGLTRENLGFLFSTVTVLLSVVNLVYTLRR